VFLTPFVEVPQPAISGTVVCARLWVPSHETKADTLNHIALGAHASRHAIVRAAKGLECHWQSTCQTAQIAISRGYAEKGQVPESTIELGVRASGFGRCIHACTRAILRKRFGPDAHISLTWAVQTWSHIGVVISRNRAETNPEMRCCSNSCATWRKGAQIGRVRTCYARRARAHLWLCHSEVLAVGRAQWRQWRGGRSDFLRPICTSKRVPRCALTYLKGDRWLYRHERRPIYYC
jgi:hypothetical protein